MPPLSDASQVAPDLQLHSEQPDSTNLMLPLASTGALAFKRIEPNTLFLPALPKYCKVASIAFLAQEQAPFTKVIMSASNAWQILAFMSSLSNGAWQTPSMIITS